VDFIGFWLDYWQKKYLKVCLIVSAGSIELIETFFISNAINRKLFENQIVFGERARLIAEKILNLTEIFIQIGTIRNGRLIIPRVVHLKIPFEKLCTDKSLKFLQLATMKLTRTERVFLFKHTERTSKKQIKKITHQRSHTLTWELYSLSNS
jgi:hypothetical protein